MSLNLVLAYESTALAAPQSFRDGMETAANILDSLISDNITVTIRVGYGDWNNGADTGLTAGAEGGDLLGHNWSYANLRTALASHETDSVDQTFVNSLPNTSSVNGHSSFYVPSAGNPNFLQSVGRRRTARTHPRNGSGTWRGPL